MQRANGFLLNLIFVIQVLLLFLLVFERQVVLPTWLQVAGRLHPAMLHVPIGLLVFLAIMLLMKSEFKEKPFRRMMLVLLTLIALAASTTALFGFFLSLQGGYQAESILQHKIGGTLLSFLCYGILVIYNYYETAKPVFYTLIAFTLGFMFWTGHSGGSITHGENFVLAPLTGRSEDVNDDASVYQALVFPILEMKCISCHNETKAKGKLVMTSVADFKRGGEHGKEWTNGMPGESRLIKVINLPIENEDHMPPDGKPQLTNTEIQLLELWIKKGADFDVTLRQLKDDDSLRIFAKSLEAKTIPDGQPLYDFAAASEDVIENLNSPLRAVFPLFQGSPALQADFFAGEAFSVSTLEELDPVKDQVVILNLARVPLTDNDLAVISRFQNLEKLNVNFSGVSGAGLSSLKSLKKLKSVSLAGTQVDANAIETLFDLPSLRELFLWNTKVTEEDRQALERKFPQVAVITTQFKNDKTLKLGKPGLANEGIIRKDERVVLKHSMPGVKIFYTLDGTQPDTIKGTVYNNPIELQSTRKLKAIACKDGWYCSSLFEITCFLDGYTPEKTELLSKTDSYFRGDGVKVLTDKELGFIEVLNAPPWLGYKETPFITGFDFGSHPPEINAIVISYADNPGGAYFPPEVVEVWGGRSADNLKLITSMKPRMPEKNRAQQVEALHVPMSSSRFNYYKVVGKPVSRLPAWHDAKGKKGWFLIDEVIFN